MTWDNPIANTMLAVLGSVLVWDVYQMMAELPEDLSFRRWVVLPSLICGSSMFALSMWVDVWDSLRKALK